MKTFESMNFDSRNAALPRRPDSGFTLIELLVALAMSLFLMGGVMLMYLSARATFLDSNQLSRIQENVRFASDYMVRDIRNAGFVDEMSLTVGQEIEIRNQFVQLNADGDELTVRYAGRGHCQDEFDEYRPVENTYCFDPANGELRCFGRIVGDVAGNCSSGGIALVAGLTGVGFEILMADLSTAVGATTCTDNPLADLDERCLGVRIGLEFEGMRDLDNPGQLDTRFVELFATFRNASLGHIYRNLE